MLKSIHCSRIGLTIAGLLLCMLSMSSCGDDGSESGDSDGIATDSQGMATGGSTTGGDTAYVCDPVGANPTMGQLLNAPLGSDVQIIVKTPQHPGQPGPTKLP